MSSESNFSQQQNNISDIKIVSQFVEKYTKQQEQIQSLFDEARKTNSYSEVMTAVDKFLGNLPPNVYSSIDYRSLSDAWKSALEKFVKEKERGDVFADCIVNTINEAIEDYYSVIEIKMLIHTQLNEDDIAIKTAKNLIKQIEPTSDRRKTIYNGIGTESFLTRFKKQYEQIHNLFIKKSYSEAERAIENFCKSLPNEVAFSTDYSGLENAWKSALESFFQDFEKGDVFTECFYNLIEQAIKNFYQVMEIKMRLEIERQEFDKKSDKAIKTGLKLLSLLPSTGEDELLLRIYLMLGSAYSKQEKFDEALSWYEKASTMSPSDEYVWLNKGIVTSKKALRDDSPELFEQALNYFKDTLTFTPDSIGAQVGLAFTKELLIKPREFRNKLISHEEEILDGGKNVITESNDYLKKILNDMRTGLNIAMIMFIIQFFVGLFLIFLSVWLLMEGYDAKFNALIGSSGALISVIALYLSAPLKIQQNRVDLAQWNIIFSNWANAIYTTNTLIAQKIRRGENTKEFTQEMNNYLQAVTNDTVTLISENLKERTEKGS